jgi:putative colanic acid biosynthesis UDP-glucose lipid carrier transferase
VLGVRQNSNLSPKVTVASVAAPSFARASATPNTDLVRPNVVGLASKRSYSSLGSPWLFTLSEFVVVFLSSIIANALYHYALGGYQSVSIAAAIGVISGLLFAGGMHIVDNAYPMRSMAGPEALRDASLIWVGVILVVLFLAFAVAEADILSRGSIFSFAGVAYVGAVGLRVFVPPALSGVFQAKGRSQLVVSVCGSSAAHTLISELRSLGHSDITHFEVIVGARDLEWQAALRFTVGSICSAVRNKASTDICIVAAEFPQDRVADLADALRIIPTALHVLPDARDSALLRYPLRRIGQLYAVELQKNPMNSLQRTGKRLIDIFISVPLLLFIAPLLLALALTIKLESRGPILFMQRRTGYMGKTFAILKFRSMNVLEDGETVKQACPNDERVTSLGRWLRRTSLDELPQLLNVVMGHMSLVGPRPHAVAHDTYYGAHIDNYDVRHHVKPGITGWAQVNGLRGATESLELMRERVKYDLSYARNASLWLDMRILAQTAWVLSLGQGNAY